MVADTTGRMLAAAWLAAVTLLPHSAVASVQSQSLYTRGLVEFHAERFDAALRLFDDAVAADPEDVYARYYRAVTRGRLQDLDGAISDLEVVLAAKPDLDRAALDLGAALVEKERYRDAIPWLQQAQRSAELDAQASLFLGVAQLRLGEAEQAAVNFERAESRDPSHAVTARYYQGVAAYQRGRFTTAKGHFAYVTATSPGAVMAREADAFMEKIRTLHTQRPYQVYGSVGFQYDSNVVLAPGDDILKDAAGISQQEDGRSTLSAGVTYVPWHTDDATLSLGYDFFQSLHFDLTEFNLQNHGPSADLAADLGWLRAGVFGRYDYYLLETDSFLQEATAMPWFTVPLREFGRFEFYNRVRRRDFKQQAYHVRDAFNYAIGIRQTVFLGAGNRYVSVGYQFDREDPVINSRLVNPDDADAYGYDGNEANLALGWTLPASIVASGTFAYRAERYKPQSALPPNPQLASYARHDDEWLVTAVLSRPLTAYLDLTVAYLGNFNDSNQSLFDYDRSIVSITLDVRY